MSELTFPRCCLLFFRVAQTHLKTNKNLSLNNTLFIFTLLPFLSQKSISFPIEGITLPQSTERKKMLKTKTFQGANVFMSRNLVPPEVFDALHDAVKDNGAQIHLCCDPSRNGPNDYHIISCSKHVILQFHSSIFPFPFSIFFLIFSMISFSILQEKFEDLKSKGCKMLGKSSHDYCYLRNLFSFFNLIYEIEM